MKSGINFPSDDAVNKLFEDKEAFHREMAGLPFEEKIEILVRLQRLASGIEPADGKPRPLRKAWEI
jgi:hypothetical protein